VQRPGGSASFSPYDDVTLAAPFDLAGVAEAAGARSLTLAFVTAAEGCRPSWGGQTPIGSAAVSAPVGRLEAAGVAMRVSFGGASGTELALSCRNIPDLEAAYGTVLDRYHATAADFDLEGRALVDRAAIARRAAAVAALQSRSGRRLAVTLTVPVTPRGLGAPALAAVRSMRAAGVRLDAVNLLAMDYGSSTAGGSMGVEAIRAALAAHRQLAKEGLPSWRSLGVTVMVGMNDSRNEVLTVSDAEAVARFARSHALGLTSIWSLARDGPCTGSPTVALPTCSGVGAPAYTFSRVFGANSKRGVGPRRVLDTS
jgi:chitinase